MVCGDHDRVSIAVMLFVEGVTAIAFASLHILGRRLRFLDRVPRSRLLSAAGGVAVAYVFVHLLPELAAAQETVAGRVSGPLARVDAHLYLVALLGLVVFYGLERQAMRSRSRQRQRHGVDEAETQVAWVTFGSYAAYNVVIGYLLTERGDPVALATFAAALGIHFLVVDHGLRDRHGRNYRRWGRWLVGAATVLGWMLGVAVDVPQPAVGGVLGFLAGGVVMNTIKEELPEERQSRLSPFVAGAAGYAALLLLV